MKSGRSTKGSYFECRDCGGRIHRASYRATCPACGGSLRSVRAAPGRTGAGEAPRGGG